MSIQRRTAKSIADLMIGHYENPMESPEEFLEDGWQVAYIENLLEDNHDMYHQDLLTFRKHILAEVAKQLDVTIKFK